ncbi:nitrite transporter NAR1 [Chlorella sorokiniana]|jgi:formate/nitrite transporter|uniref:Nitrite transporter NAR1 n=1 Tax=Chlorella sorokiniana TaxID=3076 RepID=A0A2P6TRJ5_CHLSO|nr:nitrite transporter NAR1 [Chlorella sorokiniana]|eukprot:PRW56687.1 nitrite transporter NAR1 [Chlorella sorokiniana]
MQAAQILGCGALPMRASVRLGARARPVRIVAQAAPERPAGGGARFTPGSGSEQPPAAPLPQTPYQAPSYQAMAAAAGGTVVVQPTTSVSINGEVATNGVLSPPQIYEKAAAAGAYKCNLPWWKIVLLGCVAGCYVGLGGALLLTVGPNCYGIAQTNPGLAKYITGAIGFPYALLQIIVCGSELFTGNTALCFTAFLEGKVKFSQVLKNWICAYAGNILGCALMLAIFTNTGLLPQLSKGAEAMALYKTAAPFKETFLKAICANWFVCLAVWQCLGANSFGGKFIACLGPVSAFVCIGLEHCIANLFFVPLGIFVGANVTFQQFLVSNLIPVTLGNIVAGTICMATVYSLLYGALGRKITGEAKTA